MPRLDGRTLEGYAKRAENIALALYAQADDETREAGRAWYPNADRIAREVGERMGRTVAHGAVALAILSQRTRWSVNVRAAYTLADGTLPTSDVIHSVCVKARDACASDDPISFARGPKISAFCRAILGDADAVVWDAHMLRLVRLTSYDLWKAGVPEALTRGWQRAAAKVGETPRDLQAIVWIVARGAAE